MEQKIKQHLAELEVKEKKLMEVEENYQSEKVQLQKDLQQKQIIIVQLKEIEVQSNFKKEEQLSEIMRLKEQLKTRDGTDYRLIY